MACSVSTWLQLQLQILVNSLDVLAFDILERFYEFNLYSVFNLGQVIEVAFLLCLHPMQAFTVKAEQGIGMGLAGVHQDILQALRFLVWSLRKKRPALSSRRLRGSCQSYQKCNLFSDFLLNFLFLPQCPQKLVAGFLIPEYLRILHIDEAHR